jgi:general secretion pathway protein G
MMLQDRLYRRRQAFTLMEIIVVVAIILILAGAGAIVLPKVLIDARVSRTKLDLASIESMVLKYQIDKGRLPQTLVELTQSENGTLAYMDEKLLKDPFGQDWDYNPSMIHQKTGKPRIGSQGPPGQNMPVYNWTQ